MDLVLAPYAFQVVVALLALTALAYAFAPVNECDHPDCHARHRKDWCYWHHRPKSHCRSKHRLR
jgi:hypothetical protein